MVKKEPKYRMIQKELQEEIISDNYIFGDRFYSEAAVSYTHLTLPTIRLV